MKASGFRMEKFETSHYVLANLLKILLVIICLLGLFILGLMVGYSMIGAGKATDVFHRETWTHIFQFLQP